MKVNGFTIKPKVRLRDTKMNDKLHSNNEIYETKIMCKIVEKSRVTKLEK